MNGKAKFMMAAMLVCVGTCAFARPHHHHNEGLELANGIVDLVCKVLRPAPVVVAPAPAVFEFPPQDLQSKGAVAAARVEECLSRRPDLRRFRLERIKHLPDDPRRREDLAELLHALGLAEFWFHFSASTSS